MAATATIHARIDGPTKLKAVKILHSLGMTPSEAISLFFKQIIYRRGIPFALTIPNKESLKAMAEVETGKGLHEVSSADELLKELNR